MVWKRIGSLLRFSFDDKNTICLDSTCFATGENISYLVAFFNTTIGNYLFCNAPKTGTGDLLISVQAISPLIVYKPNSIQKEKIDSILQLILSHSNSNTNEKILEDYFYKIYGFNNTERQFIEEYVNSNNRA